MNGLLEYMSDEQMKFQVYAANSHVVIVCIR